MDTTDPQIVFNQDGFCNHCTHFIERFEQLKHLKKDEKYLINLVKKIKERGKGSKYDVLLGISGGVDSCYVAYKLKELGLRTLLVHMDNGWNTNQSILNITNAIRTLGFDYQSYVLDWEEFKDIQLAFLKASVVEAETPTDIGILGALHRVAAKNNIHYIISGGNMATEGIMPKLWHYNAKDKKYFNYIQKTFGTKKVRKFPGFDFFTEVYFKFIKHIEIIYLFNYIHYDRVHVMKILHEQFDWKEYGGKHHESHFTKFIQAYLLPKKFNLDYRKATLSSKICAGAIARDEAIDILKARPYIEEDIERQKEYIAKKLGITKEELNNIVELPGKYYYEYPNNERKLNFLYKTYRKYFSISFPFLDAEFFTTLPISVL